MEDPEKGERGPPTHDNQKTSKEPEDLDENRLFKFARDTARFAQFEAEVTGVAKDRLEALAKAKDARQNSALHYAAKAGNIKMCEWLAENGADIIAEGQNKMKPLQFAARYGDGDQPETVWNCMDWLMEQYVKQKEDDSKRGVPAIVQWFRNEKKSIFDVGEKDKNGFTILHHAIQNTNWHANTFVVSQLRENPKFSITDEDSQGNTCLHMAALFDKEVNHTILDVFLDGATIRGFSDEDLKLCVEKDNHLGQTPLHIACSVGNFDSVKQLLSKTNLNLDFKDIVRRLDKEGRSPLEMAIQCKNVEMIEILVKRGARVTKEAFHCAAR